MQRIMAKAGPATARAMRDLLINITAAPIAQKIWGPP
jgi:hypothetical protein